MTFVSRGFEHERLLISITGNIFGSYNIHETMPTVFEFDIQSFSSLSFRFAGYFLISLSRATHWLRLDNIDLSPIQVQCS